MSRITVLLFMFRFCCNHSFTIVNCLAENSCPNYLWHSMTGWTYRWRNCESSMRVCWCYVITVYCKCNHFENFYFWVPGKSSNKLKKSRKNNFYLNYRMDAIENENSSCLRRGAAVAHSIYGVATTINASGYGYFLALEKLFDLQHADVRFYSFHYCWDIFSYFRLWFGWTGR